jgi:hypothetical protein
VRSNGHLVVIRSQFWLLYWCSVVTTVKSASLSCSGITHVFLLSALVVVPVNSAVTLLSR